MTCPAYGSTSNMSLYYATDADPDAAIAASTITWNEVPITSESLAANLTSSISDRITAARSYANSVVTQGEVSGSIGYETEANSFMDAMIQAALQVTGTWSAGDAIKNGSTVSCLMFLKKVKNSAGTYDYYVFRGCQVDSMSINVAPGAFITGELTVMGTRAGSGALAATDDSNNVLTALPGSWTLAPLVSTNLMSSVFALQNLEVQDDAGADIGVIAQELSLSLSNQLRQQFAVGTGSPYAAGVASGRFQCTATLNAYYSAPTIVNKMLSDASLKLVFDLKDAAGAGWSFLCDFVKITSAPPPQASGPDADVMSSTELQAFESATHGSIEITKVTGYTLGSEASTNGTFASDLTGWEGTNWAYDAGNSGQALHTAGATDPLLQAIAIVSGTTYEIAFTSEDRTAGNFSVMLGNQLLNVNGVSNFTTDGTYTGRIRANQTATVPLMVVPSSLYDGAIATISMKPVVWS